MVIKNPYLPLLTEAERDIRAAKVLLNEQLYPRAAFSFQQAVEKASKFWGVSQNWITIDEIKKIGHKSDKIFRYIFTRGGAEPEATKEYDKFFGIVKQLPNMDERVDFIWRELEAQRRTTFIPVRDNESYFDAFVRFYNENPDAKTVKGTLYGYYLKWKDMPNREEMMKDFIIGSNTFFKAPQYLMLLSFLVIDTEQNTRYPDITANTTTDKLYNESTMYIQRMPLLLPFFQLFCKRLRKYFSKVKDSTAS